MKKITRTKISESLPIISDGAMANTDIADGRLIPVLIVDCTKRSDVSDLVHMHSDTPPGDVGVQWFRELFSDRHVYLSLRFERPMDLRIQFKFNVATHGSLVDIMLRARAVYLQPGAIGERFSGTIQNPKILVELPSPTRLPGWDDIYRRSITKKYRQSGLGKNEARKATDDYLSRMREIMRLRKNRTLHAD